MRFKFSAKNAKGQPVSGVIAARDEAKASDILKNRGYEVTSLVVQKGFWEWVSRVEFGRIRYVDRLFFTKHLSVMIRAGLPLDEALDILAEQTHALSFRKVLQTIHKSIVSGNTFSSSLRKYTKIFGNLYINVISAGESSGTLDKSLDNLSIQLTKSHELRQKIRSALAYPLFVMGLTVVIAFTLAVFVLPKITGLFGGLKVELPLLTRILINVSSFFQANSVLVTLGAIGGTIGLFFLARTRQVQPLIHKMLLNIPIAGRVVRYANLAIFSRTLSTLLKSGVPINEAMSIVSETVRNVMYRRQITRFVADIQKGMSLSEIISREKYLFPPLVYRMIGVGETSGNLEEVLAYLAEFFESEVDNVAKTLSTVVEPLLLAVIGFMVGFVAIAIITPIYQITSGLIE